jgi:hypothetical protein
MMPDEFQVDAALTPAPESAHRRDESSDSAITEDLALAQLKAPDLSSDAIEQLCRNASLMKSRKFRMAMASHLRTPRRIALRIIRELYTFELMQFALRPTAAADLKRIADELLLSRLPSITLGERISLARRSSTVVAAGLLLDKEPHVWQLALENARLTEVAIVKALQRPTGTRAFVEAVSHHAKWSVRHEVQVALLRNAHTPLAKALEFARRMPARQLRDILHASRLPETIKSQLRKERDLSGE